MSSDPLLASISMFSGNFAPRGWAFCDGQILPIGGNTSLFSLIGTTYGGDGRTTLGLPDLRGRVPIHAGRGSVLSPYTLGQTGGEETVTLSERHLPSHSHGVLAVNVSGNIGSPSGATWAKTGITDQEYNNSLTPNTPMHSGIIQDTGGGQPFNILQPYLVINFVIALMGVYPSRR